MNGTGAALDATGVSYAYGKIEALRSVSLTVPSGRVIALIGANGAGKTTLLHCLAGLLRPSAGRLLVFGRDVTTRPAYSRPRDGVGLVPEGRQVFAEQSVRVNLELGAFSRRDSRRDRDADFDRVFQLFPVLFERQHQIAGTLSGGEQQMLAIGRALMARPRLLLLDEPSMGLAPLMVADIFRALVELRASGLSMLLVEQNARLALQLGDYAYVMETGRIVLEGEAATLVDNSLVRQIYLGERGLRGGEA